MNQPPPPCVQIGWILTCIQIGLTTHFRFFKNFKELKSLKILKFPKFSKRFKGSKNSENAKSFKNLKKVKKSKFFEIFWKCSKCLQTFNISEMLKRFEIINFLLKFSTSEKFQKLQILQKLIFFLSLKNFQKSKNFSKKEIISIFFFKILKISKFLFLSLVKTPKSQNCKRFRNFQKCHYFPTFQNFKNIQNSNHFGSCAWPFCAPRTPSWADLLRRPLLSVIGEEEELEKEHRIKCCSVGCNVVLDFFYLKTSFLIFRPNRDIFDVNNPFSNFSTYRDDFWTKHYVFEFFVANRLFPTLTLFARRGGGGVNQPPLAENL